MHDFENLHVKKEEFKSNASFSRCTFESCQFSHCKLTDIRECTFKNCSFTHIDWQGRVSDVIFDECKIVGAAFYKCEQRFFSPQFKNSILLACNFSDMKLKRLSFAKCKVKECYFNQTQAQEANFKEADLEGTLFHHADLSRADFRGAINYSINPQNNVLKGALFSTPEALSLLSFFHIKID
jgi:fluoroquinolone resistance protein